MTFVKGKSGNPAGRPKDPADIHTMKILTRADFARLVTKFMGMGKEELGAYVNRPETTMLEHMVLSVMAKAATGGDDKRLNFLLDRLIGKVTDKLQIAGVVKTESKIKLENLSESELSVLEKVLGDVGETSGN